MTDITDRDSARSATGAGSCATLDWPAAWVEAASDWQRTQVDAWSAWADGVAAWSRELLDAWVAHWGGGVPIDG